MKMFLMKLWTSWSALTKVFEFFARIRFYEKRRKETHAQVRDFFMVLWREIC